MFCHFIVSSAVAVRVGKVISHMISKEGGWTLHLDMGPLHLTSRLHSPKIISKYTLDVNQEDLNFYLFSQEYNFD